MAGFTTNIQGEDQRETVVADRELYTDDDWSQLLEAGDPNAGVLLAAGEGKVIPADYVERLGLVSEGGKVRQKKTAKDSADGDTDDPDGAKERRDGKDKQRRDGKDK